jgi:hypothetical protein
MEAPMKQLLIDCSWGVVGFAAMTVVAYWLRGQGVDVPSLPDWVTGL